MCDKCLAIIENAPRVYRRPLTAIELEWGDVDNVRDQMEASEEGVVKIAKPVLVKIVAQLVDEYRPLVERGDIAGVARVSPSFTGDLAQALRVAQQSAVTRGKRQVLTMAKKAGVRLAAKRPGKDPAKAAAYLEARSEAMSEQIQAQIAASVKRTVLGAAAVGEWDDEIAETIIDDLVVTEVLKMRLSGQIAETGLIAKSPVPIGGGANARVEYQDIIAPAFQMLMTVIDKSRRILESLILTPQEKAKAGVLGAQDISKAFAEKRERANAIQQILDKIEPKDAEFTEEQ